MKNQIAKKKTEITSASANSATRTETTLSMPEWVLLAVL
jgi:hypothetical protein